MPSDSEQDDKLAILATITVARLKKALREVNISFKETVLKAELQALWALQKLGYLDASADPNPLAFETILMWCKRGAGWSYNQDLEERGLPFSVEDIVILAATKWKCVQRLIEYEYANSSRKTI